MATAVQAAVQSEPSRRQFYARLNGHNWDKKEDIIKYVQDGVKTIADKDDSDPTFVSLLLHFYAETKDKVVVDSVINAAITSNQKLVNEVGGPDRTTPLHSTILKQRMAVFEKLIALKADIKAKDSMGRLPLHYAAILGKMDFVKHLLSRTIASRFAPNDPLGTSTQDCDGMTPLATACQHRKYEVINHLLQDFPASCQLADLHGRTPFHISASLCDSRTVDMLLTHAEWMEGKNRDRHAVDTATVTRSVSDDATRSNTTFNIDKKTNAGHTALHLACINGGLETVKLLLFRHADPTITSDDGENCLWSAVRNGHTAIVIRLLRKRRIVAAVNNTNTSGFTLLSVACQLKASPKIVQQLVSVGGVDWTKGNRDGSTPITEAIRCGHGVALGLFLESSTLHNINEAILYKRKVKTTPTGQASTTVQAATAVQPSTIVQSSTALHFACRHGQPDAIIALIGKGADKESRDAEGLTVLHEASRLGNANLVTTLLREGCEPDARDHKGLTPLHHACAEAAGSRNLQYASDDKLISPSKDLYTISDSPVYIEDYDLTIRRLMQCAPLHAQTLIGNSALHLAARRGHRSRVDCLLSHKDIIKTLELSNAANETPLICALEKRYFRIAEKLVHKMKSVRFRDKETRDKYLRTLVEHQEFNLVASLLHKEAYAQNLARLHLVRQDATALEMAAFIGSAQLVWWLLRNSSPGPVLDHDTRAAIQICIREKDYWISIKNKRQELDAHAETTDCQNSKAIEAIEQTLDLLQYPPPITSRDPISAPIPRRASKLQPQSTKLMDDYRVKFMVLQASRVSQTSVSIEEALLQARPSDIMKKRPNRTPELDEKYRYPNSALESPAEQQSVRWIHLPANNTHWMRDMAKAIHDDRGIKTEPGPSSQLYHTFHEVRGRRERTGYMKPQCVTGTVDSKCVAVYMPFVAPAWFCTKPNRLSLRYADLLEHCQSQGCVMHGTRTLDEYYYHFCMDSKSEESIQAHNKDQILSKVLHKDLNDRKSWILINVDQLWIWVLSPEIILTSATHRRDHESDPVVTVTAAALREALNANEALPSNAFDMADFIISKCIDSFDATFEMKPPPTAAGGQEYTASTASWCARLSGCPCGCSLKEVHPSGWRRRPSSNNDTPTQVCIKDSFTSIIAQTAMEEKALHKSVMAGEKRSLDSESSYPEPSRDAYTVAQDAFKAGHLCREVKDVRDELKILKVVAEHQQNVQQEYRKATAAWHDLDRPARNLVSELVDMDCAVQNMESSLNVTLTLQQNAAAIAQAAAAARQGEFTLFFTVVAVIFLPPSFITSLFAMQVETALKSPPWVFGLMFGVAGSIWLIIAAYVYCTTKGLSVRNLKFPSDAWRKLGDQWIIVRGKIWFAERGLLYNPATPGRDSRQASKRLVDRAHDVDFDEALEKDSGDDLDDDVDDDVDGDSNDELSSDLGGVDPVRR